MTEFPSGVEKPHELTTLQLEQRIHGIEMSLAESHRIIDALPYALMMAPIEKRWEYLAVYQKELIRRMKHPA